MGIRTGDGVTTACELMQLPVQGFMPVSVAMALMGYPTKLPRLQFFLGFGYEAGSEVCGPSVQQVATM
ncbi:MAG: hypothetical protein ACKPKO_28035, partial [Candidatus Fonsibacter sp.]